LDDLRMELGNSTLDILQNVAWFLWVSGYLCNVPRAAS
jgi:hypothetical protein